MLIFLYHLRFDSAHQSHGFKNTTRLSQLVVQKIFNKMCFFRIKVAPFDGNLLNGFLLLCKLSLTSLKYLVFRDKQHISSIFDPFFSQCLQFLIFKSKNYFLFYYPAYLSLNGVIVNIKNLL